MTDEGVSPGESARERVLPVVSQLQTISYDQVKPLLDAELAAKHKIDSKAGIVIVNLDGETETPDGRYHYHGARVLTSSPEHPNFVKPHFHTIGEEPYVVLSGSGGEMNLGRVVDEKVVWDSDSPRNVSEGETVIVKEGQVHSLRNTGEEPLDFTFACPDSHLQDPPLPGADRFFTAELPNGIPPQYPKTV